MGLDSAQAVQVIVYKGCRDEKCALTGEYLDWARNSKGNSVGNRDFSKRDLKEYLLFDREVLPTLLESVERGRSAAIMSTHTGMLRLALEKLEERGVKARRSEAQEPAAIYLGYGSEARDIDHAVVLVVDCYCRDGKVIELMPGYEILNRASNVTIMVAEELLQGGFEEARRQIIDSGSSFYRVLGELLAGQNNVGNDGKSFGIGQCFTDFSIMGKSLNIAEPRLADGMSSIFDTLKAMRVEKRITKNEEMDEWLTEKLAREALRLVVRDINEDKGQSARGLRVLREPHLDDLTGPSIQGFCQRAFARKRGKLVDAARYVLGGRSGFEEDGSCEDLHPRFDFAFIDKNTGRLLLAIEVDGDPHRYYETKEDNNLTSKEKDDLKDEFVRQIGGLVLHGNGSRHYKPEEVERTSFTLLRLPTDGSTFNEIDQLDDASMKPNRLSIQRLLKDRLEQELPPSLQVIAPHRTATELELEKVRVPWDTIPEEKDLKGAAKQTKRMKALGLIEPEDEDKPWRWRPTERGKQMCGVTLAYYGADQAECCLYPDATELRIEQGWDAMQAMKG